MQVAEVRGKVRAGVCGGVKNQTTLRAVLASDQFPVASRIAGVKCCNVGCGPVGHIISRLGFVSSGGTCCGGGSATCGSSAVIEIVGIVHDVTDVGPVSCMGANFCDVCILQLHVGTGSRADFGSLGLSDHAEQFRYCDGGQDAHDHDHDHQFDKGKTLLFHSVLLVVLLHTFLSFSPVSGVQLVYVLNIQSFFPKSNRFVKIFCIFVKLFSRFCHVFVTKNYFVINRRFPDLPFLVEIRHIS